MLLYKAQDVTIFLHILIFVCLDKLDQFEIYQNYFEIFSSMVLEREEFKVCKSVHHHTIQINQPTRCNNFLSLLLDVYVQLNIFRASSRPLSGAQQLQ